MSKPRQPLVAGDVIPAASSLISWAFIAWGNVLFEQGKQEVAGDLLGWTMGLAVAAGAGAILLFVREDLGVGFYPGLFASVFLGGGAGWGLGWGIRFGPASMLWVLIALVLPAFLVGAGLTWARGARWPRLLAAAWCWAAVPAALVVALRW